MIERDWAEGLDDQQLAAAEHGREPLVVVAGAGTGKTRTLTARVARLLEAGVAPERVLLLTFTRRAAAAMTSRAAALCGDPAAGRRVWGGTFHAIAHRLVAEHAAALGLSEVSVLDSADVVERHRVLQHRAHPRLPRRPAPRRQPLRRAGLVPPAVPAPSHRPGHGTRTHRCAAGTGGDDGYASVVAGAPPKARTGLQATLGHLAAAQSSPTSREIVEHCHAAVRPLVRAHYADWQHRLDDVDRLAGTAGAQADLRGFVAELTIDPATSSADYAKAPRPDEDYLTLSTVHSAKGLEWTAVHLIHAVDGAFPSDMALSTDDGLAEEQRLFYVALTRARDTLTVYVPRRMPVHATGYTDRQALAKPSRFLTPEARAVIDRHDQVGEQRTISAALPSAAVEMPTLQGLFT